MRLLISGTAALVGAAVLSACGTAGPTTLQSAAADSPEGTQRVTCDVGSADGPVTFALDLPTGFHAAASDGEGECVWSMSVHVKDGTYGDAYDTDVRVAVYATGKNDALQDIYDEQEPDAVHGDDAVLDDSILDLELSEDVPTYGDTVGDRLSYLCFCDGQNNLVRYAQADGVRIGWYSVQELEQQTDKQLAAALATAGTIR